MLEAVNAAPTTDPVLLENIRTAIHAYSGKPGCCCGCRGKHRYASSAAGRGKELRGYEISSDEISDVSIKRAASFFLGLLERGEMEGVEIFSDMISWESETRVKILYFGEN